MQIRTRNSRQPTSQSEALRSEFSCSCAAVHRFLFYSSCLLVVASSSIVLIRFGAGLASWVAMVVVLVFPFAGFFWPGSSSSCLCWILAFLRALLVLIIVLRHHFENAAACGLLAGVMLRCKILLDEKVLQSMGGTRPPWRLAGSDRH